MTTGEYWKEAQLKAYAMGLVSCYDVAKELGEPRSSFAKFAKRVNPVLTIGRFKFYDQVQLLEAWENRREIQLEAGLKKLPKSILATRMTRPELVKICGLSKHLINNTITRCGIKHAGHATVAGRKRRTYLVADIATAYLARQESTRAAKQANAAKARETRARQYEATRSEHIEKLVMECRAEGMKVMKIARVLKVDIVKVLEILAKS